MSADRCCIDRLASLPSVVWAFICGIALVYAMAAVAAWFGTQVKCDGANCHLDLVGRADGIERWGCARHGWIFERKAPDER